jgi:hypothetical protein
VKRIVTIASAIVMAAGGAAGFAASASASTARPTASGTESFELLATGVGAQGAIKFKAIYYGVVTAAGTEASPSSGNTDTVRLPGGTFELKHGTPPGLRLTSVKTCLASGAGKVKYQLTDGTGRYKGISGSGSAEVTELALLGKVHGACTEQAPPLGLFIVVKGHGRAHL